MQAELSSLRPAGDQAMELVWSDERKYILEYLILRCLCPCAHCVDELTGKRVVSPTSIDPQVRVIRASAVGLYAVQLHFSDGHQTGIFDFSMLLKLCESHGKLVTKKEKAECVPL